MESIYEQRAKVFKAFCDERRQKILELLQQGEQCACKLIEGTGMAQSTLSYHMKILCESGIVEGREVGKWTHYRISPQGVAHAESLLHQITTVTRPTPVCPDCQPEISQPKENPVMEGNTKLYVLTGFLGSGKTTLLLKILENLRGHRVGIIQNEFGKLSIDGDILRNDDIQMVEITRGSIFCSCLKLSFVAALAEMAQQNFEYLFVESSGLGDPSNVEEILQAAELASGKKFDFGGVLCMVDAYNFLQQVEDEETVNRQLKHCHLAAITKSDLVDEAQLAAITDKIRSINPVCRLEESHMGDLDLGFLQDDLLLYQWAEGEASINLKENKPKTLFMNFEGAVEREKLLAFFRKVIPGIYRSKGFFQLAGEGWIANCLGLENCRQNKVGYFNELYYDDETFKTISTPCSYQQKILLTQEKQNNLLLIGIDYSLYEGELFTNPRRKEVLAKVKKILVDYEKNQLNKGMYLHGSYGCGKTFILAFLAKTLADSGANTIFAYYPDLVRKIKSLIGKSEFEEIVEKLKNIEVLVLDDFGGETPNSFIRDEVLLPILQERMTYKRPTFMSSNLNAEHLLEHLAEGKSGVDMMRASRVWERIKVLMDFVELNDNNYR